MYKSREDFISDNVSEKITLAHVSASTRLYGFQDLGSGVYSKVTPFFVTDIKDFESSCDLSSCSVGITSLNLNNGEPILLNSGDNLESNQVVLDSGSWVYDYANKTLYIRTDGDIDNVKIIATYRLFFSDAPVITTWNLKNESVEVEYESRIQTSPSFKTQIGTNQRNISLTNSGSLKLNNSDGYFDELYDFLVFENKNVEVFSYSRRLKPEDSKIIFRGNIYDKSFSSNDITFQVKDNYTRLDESLALDRYLLSDGVSSIDVDKFKRRIYGQADGVLCKSVDQISQGYDITGTLSVDLNSPAQVTGDDTLFITQTDGGATVFEVSDIIEVENQRFEILSISSENSMVISSEDPIYFRAEESNYSKVVEVSLPGSVTTSILNPKTISGTGTSFTTDFSTGDKIQIRDISYIIDDVVSDTEMTTEVNLVEEVNGSSYIRIDLVSGEGTISFEPSARLVQGSGSLFLDELSIDDQITISDQTYTIEDILSDTQLIISEDTLVPSSFSSLQARNVSVLPWRKKNRTFQVAGHALSEYETTVSGILELNKISLDNVGTIVADDILTIYDTDGVTVVETVEVLRVSSNVVTTKFNLTNIPSIGAKIKRQSIFKAFSFGSEILLKDIINIDNTVNGCFFSLSELTEFNISESRTLTSVKFQFQNGSRLVKLASPLNNLTEIVSSRDFIKARNDIDSIFSEILKVEDNLITLRTPYEGETGIKAMVYRNLSTIGDDTPVTVNCLGKTVDGTPLGEHIKTGPQIVKDLFSEISLSDFLDTETIDKADEDAPYLMSLVLPEDINSTTSPTIKTVIDRVNQSIFGSMTISNDLRIRYSILDVSRPPIDEMRIISIDDQIKWSVKSQSNNLYRSVNSTYRRRDYDSITKVEDFSRHVITSEFADDFDTSNKTDELSLYVYKEDEALELTERYIFVNSLSKNNITIESDLRLSDINMGDKVILNLPRLYKRLGDLTTTLKVATVIGVTISGQKTTLILSDLGNLYNRSGIISDNDSNEYDIILSSEKVNVTFITDENGVIDNIESIQNTNLIY